MKQGKRYQRMEETRAQVLRDAVVLFLEQGYRETTIDQIAGRIGRTKSAVLRAYPDKEAILYALVTHMFRVQFSTARSLLGEKADPLLVYCVETAMQLQLRAEVFALTIAHRLVLPAIHNQSKPMHQVPTLIAQRLLRILKRIGIEGS